jgi:hypothetical protein
MGMLKIECERRVEDRQKDARYWKWMEQWNVLKLDEEHAGGGG